MQAQVKEWLESGKVDVFLGYKMVHGHPLPHFFTADNLDEVGELVVSRARYSLEKIATKLSFTRPGVKIGLLVRDCNQRALNVLYVWNQMNPENVSTISVNCCPSKLKVGGDCSYLEYRKIGSVKKQLGVENNLDVEAVEEFAQKERFNRWLYEFQKCIKCYGCRDICPV